MIESGHIDVAEALGFDGVLLARLERLALMNKRPLPGPSMGPRRSPRRGSSVEFADYREYVVGDDFRRVDWKAFGRLDRLFLRLYVAEEITTVSLLLDRSASMAFGKPAKSFFAAQLAAVFAYVSLCSYDAVAVAGWGEKIEPYIPPRRGEASLAEVWNSIVRIMVPELMGSTPKQRTSPGTDWACLRHFGYLRREPGMVIVISDVLSTSDWRAGLRALRSARQEVALIQVLAPEEIDPTIRGDWRLHDSETGADIELTVSGRAVKRYREELARYTEEIESFCRQQGVTFLQMSSGTSLADLALHQLYAAEFLR